MCGRYSQSQNLTAWWERFGLKNPPAVSHPPRYNIAPGQQAPVILIMDGTREPALFQWGLIPSWAKDPSIGKRMINARSETLSEKPSFKRLLPRARCLVLADGFYEWRKEPGGEAKIPMRIRLRSGEPFAFAGLWDRWKNPTGGETRSYTIITTRANEALAPIHERMPVILTPEGEDRWLDPETPVEKLGTLLEPFPLDAMEAYPVSRLVNSPKNDVPDCIRPL